MAGKLNEKTDTPIRLLKDIEAGYLDASDLTQDQRRSCLVGLANGKRTSYQLSEIFKVGVYVIRRDLAHIRRTIGREVREWTLDEVVGDLALAAEKATAGAMAEGDVGLMWTVRKEFAKFLIDVGVVKKQDDENTFRATIELVGKRYEHATEAITQVLDPLLTGMVRRDQRPTGVPELPMPVRAPRGKKGFDHWPLLEPGAPESS